MKQRGEEAISPQRIRNIRHSKTPDSNYISFIPVSRQDLPIHKPSICCIHVVVISVAIRHHLICVGGLKHLISPKSDSFSQRKRIPLLSKIICDIAVGEIDVAVVVAVVVDCVICINNTVTVCA